MKRLDKWVVVSIAFLCKESEIDLKLTDAQVYEISWVTEVHVFVI